MANSVRNSTEIAPKAREKNRVFDSIDKNLVISDSRTPNPPGGGGGVSSETKDLSIVFKNLGDLSPMIQSPNTR